MSTTPFSIETLIYQREHVMDRADRALDAAWPERKGKEYISEMTTVANELEAIAKELSEANAHKIEQSRAYRYLGSVYADLEPAQGKRMLSRALEAYALAEERLIDQPDELEQAKLDFNIGNALRQLDANNVEQLQNARQRFQNARFVMSKSAPHYVAQIDQALASVDNLLAIAPVAATVNKNIADVNQLSEQMEQSGYTREIAEKFDALKKRDGGAAALLGQLHTFVDTLPEDVRQSEQYDSVKGELNEVTKMAQETDNLDSQEAQIMDALSKRLAADLDADKVEPQRAENLQSLLGNLGGILGKNDDDLSGMVDKLQELRAAYRDRIDTMHYLSHGIARPPAGSRAAELVERCWLLRRYLAEEMGRPNKGAEESSKGLDLITRATKLDKQIYQAGSDDKRTQLIDADVLRPMTSEIREFAGRFRSMVARPFWGSTQIAIDNSAVFYSGASDLQQSISHVCQGLNLNVMPYPKGESYAKARWKHLLKATIAVFDMRKPTSADSPAVAYELGIALSLGRPIVIIGSDEEEIPFDIDIKPVLLHEGEQGNLELRQVIDQSLSWVPQSGDPSSLARTVEHILATYSTPHADTYIDQTLKLLMRQQQDNDPVAINNSLKTLKDFLNDPKTMLIQPNWSPDYPQPDDKRLFHITPFNPKFDPATEVTRRACEAQGLSYIRGDQVLDQDVIRSIWAEINRATHILVDLTDMNSNVMLELGIAHTLGKSVLMVKRGIEVTGLFPMVAKMRIHPYEDAKQLGTMVGDYVCQA